MNIFSSNTLSLSSKVSITTAESDKIIDTHEVLKNLGKADAKPLSDSSNGFFSKIASAPSKLFAFCGWAPSVVEIFDIKDVNNDGLCTLTINGKHSYTLSDVKGKRLSSANGDVNTLSFALVPGQYKLEIFHV